MKFAEQTLIPLLCLNLDDITREVEVMAGSARIFHCKSRIGFSLSFSMRSMMHFYKNCES
jgi:hypothetical protein